MPTNPNRKNYINHQRKMMLALFLWRPYVNAPFDTCHIWLDFFTAFDLRKELAWIIHYQQNEITNPLSMPLASTLKETFYFSLN